ncbi:MAG: peptide ABC transporter substrate-binding protein [Actinobacteria bacterium 13_1_20CM_2_65_11]|nr:MAG: peptide ABC transporter substrate-binding protein [Chloroflexi bacterium 13_1_40CM_65_17]OLC64537.1 MAG: peptide ABC transporter substrate-binding protein [Actinobacteria bacterium 13_1_40CM_4_65_12]OLD25486.1 MAG: peptide ABC transporter substrate-binding protein [Chloroflexi bacterium 13_1_40CM_3_65_12]OLD49769.1 MAG: peptide ABC transporter substrate-binding protein [Actinobacteria bacterium 13_1_40CM_2_65_8]OLE80669.1 MAG: peptide ABC transporter substrate-binding protein [Actinobac
MAAAAVSSMPAAGASGAKVLLRAENAVKHFPAGLGATVHAVDGVSFEIREGETLGLVGESGCGKSTLARLVTQLLPVTSGKIFFGDVELTKLRGEKLRQYRRQLQMIFQDPFASLDPRMTVGDIIAEPLDNFGVMRGRKRNARVQELLSIVGLNPNFNNRYPHEFSGGQRQRIGIARALALNPRLVVCDEAISALDVSIQAQIVNLLEDLQREFKLTYLFIAHDLSVVRHISDRVMVMYLGKIVEIADSVETYASPKHPYTKALLSAIPVPDPRVQRGRRLVELTGEIPSPIHPPSGCRFHTRCPIARLPTPCAETEPPLEEKRRDHLAACHFSSDV